MKMSGLGVSIKRPHIEEEQRNPSSNPTAAHQAKHNRKKTTSSMKGI